MKRDIHSKIKTIPQMDNLSESLRRDGKKIVHCHGCFDLLHPGHIKHFESAKKIGDVLLVTLTRDEYVNKGPGRPIFTQQLRAESIAAIEFVDYVAINDWPKAVETIKILKPHFYVKGSEYSRKSDDLTGNILEEEEAVKSVGGSLYLTDDISFSSTALINSHLAQIPDEARIFLQRFKKRHPPGKIITAIKRLGDLRVLVIGDIIIDEYHYCVGMGKTQKDNIIATKHLNDELFAGGVLASCNHLAGFCKNVTLLSVVGLVNDYRKFIENNLKPSIKRKFFYRKDVPTVVKSRFIDPSFLVKIFEICYLDDSGYVPEEFEEEICRYLKRILGNFDLVMANDFGHGCLTSKIIKLLCEKARFLAVNVQTNSSNIGFNIITKFPRADYICIDEPELRLACHDKFSDLEKLIPKLGEDMNCSKIIITRGHRPSLACSGKGRFSEIPVFSKEVVDRIGAGDAFFSLTAPCVCRDLPMETVGFIGNAVGAMKVLIVGNRSSVEPVSLYKYITTLLK